MRKMRLKSAIIVLKNYRLQYFYDVTGAFKSISCDEKKKTDLWKKDLRAKNVSV